MLERKVETPEVRPVIRLGFEEGLIYG